MQCTAACLCFAIYMQVTAMLHVGDLGRIWTADGSEADAKDGSV